MYFRNYGYSNTWVDNCLDCPVIDYLSKGNMVNGLKQCCNLNHSTFIIFIDHSKNN